MKDYHNLYNLSDVLLLADVLETLGIFAWIIEGGFSTKHVNGVDQRTVVQKPEGSFSIEHGGEVWERMRIRSNVYNFVMNSEPGTSQNLSTFIAAANIDILLLHGSIDNILALFENGVSKDDCVPCRVTYWIHRQCRVRRRYSNQP